MKENLRYSPEGEPRKIFVDIDETICFYSGKRRYDLAEPNLHNISKINKLYDKGNIITYWTARGCSQPDNINRLNKMQFQKRFIEDRLFATLPNMDSWLVQCFAKLNQMAEKTYGKKS